MRTFAAVLVIATLFAGAAVVTDARSLYEVAPSPAPPSTCATCEEFVALGEAYLNDPDTQVALDAEVKKVCAALGADKAATCEMLLEAGKQYALDFINSQGTPVATCTDAGLCPKKPSQASVGTGAGSSHLVLSSPALSEILVEGSAAVAAATAPRSKDCLKCKFAIISIHTAITSNETVSKLLEQGAALCTKYAAAFDMDAECAALVKTYGPELLQEIGDKLADPAAVCASIGQCAAPALVPAEEEKQTEAPQLASVETKGGFALVAKNLIKNIRVVRAMQAAQVKHQNI